MSLDQEHSFDRPTRPQREPKLPLSHFWFWFSLPHLVDIIGFTILPLSAAQQHAQAGILIGIFIVFANLAWGILPDILGYTSRWARGIYVGLAIGKLPIWILAYSWLSGHHPDYNHARTILGDIAGWVILSTAAALLLNGVVTVHAFIQRTARILRRQQEEIDWIEGSSAPFDDD